MLVARALAEHPAWVRGRVATVVLVGGRWAIPGANGAVPFSGGGRRYWRVIANAWERGGARGGGVAFCEHQAC